MKLIIILFGALVIGACNVTADAEREAIQWLNTAKRPVVCRVALKNIYSETKYTLIAANGEIYQTGWITLDLPDTLRGVVR